MDEGNKIFEKQIMLTDETQIKVDSFIKNSIRLSPENK